MNSKWPVRRQPAGWFLVVAFGTLVTTCASYAGEGGTTNAPAVTNAPAETKGPAATNAPAVKAAPPPLTPEQMFEGGDQNFNNWLGVSVGGSFVSGNQSQYQQQRQGTVGAFGGVDDLHLQKELNKTTTLFMDGRALFDQHDYLLKLDLEREKLGFLKLSFREFRTWYDGDGGFYPPTSIWYPLPGDALALDRGEVSFEAGLRMENLPQLTLKYTHTYREGEKDSTIWGTAHPDVGVTQGLSPSFYDIKEHSDIFQIDATHHIKATEIGAGIRYETGRLNDALKIVQSPGEPVEQKITDRQQTSYDFFNAHASTETWLKKTFLLSTGFSYSDVQNDLSGSRIYGSDFDVGYVPNALSGAGYTGLAGESRMHEYVMNLNALYKPATAWSIVPSVRLQVEDADANVSGSQTLGVNAPVPFAAQSSSEVLDLRERIDVTFNGVTNWVFYGRTDWTEGAGNLNELGGLGPVAGIGVPPIDRQTDNSRWFQKYSAGARWYPVRGLTLDAGGYYKMNNYDYTHNVDSTPNDSVDRYPGYLTMQAFETLDGNFRLKFGPWKKVTLVSRYEYQYSTIHTTPDPISGLSEVEASTMTSHIIAQDITWSPWSRLSLQAGVNYVLSETRTAASDFTQAILNAQNNYWSLNFTSSFVIDDKTDLAVSYFYYRPDDYVNNSSVGVPYGAGSEQQAITATLVRHLTKSVRVMLKYGYFHNEEELYGGNRNYTSHFISTGLQWRF